MQIDTAWNNPKTVLPEHGDIIEVTVTPEEATRGHSNGRNVSTAVYNSLSNSFIIRGKSYLAESEVVLGWRPHPTIKEMIF